MYTLHQTYNITPLQSYTQPELIQRSCFQSFKMHKDVSLPQDLKICFPSCSGFDNTDVWTWGFSVVAKMLTVCLQDQGPYFHGTAMTVLCFLDIYMNLSCLWGILFPAQPTKKAITLKNVNTLHAFKPVNG